VAFSGTLAAGDFLGANFMTRTKGRGRDARRKFNLHQTPGRNRRAWLPLLAVPLFLSGCAETPTYSGKAARPAASQRVFRVVPETSPPPKHDDDTYTAHFPELADTFSSDAVIQRLLEQKRKQQAAQAKRAGSRGGPGFAPETAAGIDADAEEAAPAKGKRKGGIFRRGKAARIELATVEPAGPMLPEAAEVKAKRGGKASGKSGDKNSGAALKVAAQAPRKSQDQWELVRGNLVLAAVEHDAVMAQLEHLRRHPGAVDFLMRRAEPYLQYLVEEINRQGLPADMVMVPMVESAFETSALSPKAAAGIWQFIPATGQRYGLPVSKAFDGRYDTHAATQAALKYLKHLNKLFGGDWLLALASYNAGEGAVQRAIDTARRAGLEGTFWDLDLPAETEAYVVKIVALSRLVADPAAFGMKPRKAVALPFLTRIQTAPEVKVADLMAASGTPPEEFFKLNPAYRPDVEPPAQVHNFLLPPSRAEALQAANLAGTKVFATRKVVVQKGETLSILAKRHGVPELKLAEWNGLSLKTRLKAGQELLVYPV
jgi:membrane-bound lytic murein transglycosylase D